MMFYKFSPKQTHLPNRDIELEFNTIIQTLTYAIATGESIPIQGFGDFSTIPRKARIGRNPKPANPSVCNLETLIASSQVRICVNVWMNHGSNFPPSDIFRQKKSGSRRLGRTLEKETIQNARFEFYQSSMDV